MLFSELVLQGVRNYQQMHRIPVGLGFSVFVGGQGAGKSTAIDVVTHLLNPNPTEPATDRFKSSDPSLCRAALLIDDDSGQRYRLVQDLLRGSMALARLDPATKQFVPVSNSPTEVRQYLTSQIHLPHIDVFEEIFITRRSSFPTAAGETTAEALGVGLPPTVSLPPTAGLAGGGGSSHFPGYQGGDSGEEVLPDNPDELRSQLNVLRHDLSMAKEVDDLQFNLDGLQSKLFKMEQKTKGVGEASSRVENLEAELGRFDKLGELPGDFERRIREFEKSKGKLDRDKARLNDEQEKWDKRANQAIPGPLTQDRNFVLGLSLGLGAIGVGVLGFFLEEYLRYVALLDIAGFGLALVAAVRHIDRSQAAQRSQARLAMIDERREKLQRQFDLESSIVRSTMVQLDVSDPQQIIEQYAARNKVAGALEKARQDLEAQKNDPAFAETESQQAQLRAEIAELEEKLAGAGGLMMGPKEMERRIGLIEDKLARTESGAPAASEQTDGWLGGEDPIQVSGNDPYDLGVGLPPAGGRPPGASLHKPGGHGLPPSPALESSGPRPGSGPFDRLMKKADDLFLVDRQRIELMLAPRAGQYLSAFSAQAQTQLSFGPGGLIEVADGTGSRTAAATLPAADQDLVYLALKLAVIENACKQQPVPVFLDDPFGGLPAGLQDLLGRALANIGSQTQVVLFTREAAWAQHATASFQL
ncbi:MAG TPA: hypothetical protein VM425_02725 [Myxococcota bacterium]|nr:hypothetical protein [Myxococcota bacterium]